ncbi:MAG: hypothetical protein WBC44_14860 [Planctomycetaceae bacterium]
MFDSTTHSPGSFDRKFSVVTLDGAHAPHDYRNRFYRQPTSDPDRLVIGASGSNVDLLGTLAARFAEQPYFVLYVLLVSHTEHKLGRYQSPSLSFEELWAFLDQHREFLEGDGRHHVWVGSPGADLLVYDQHDLIFAYGSLDAFEDVLLNRGFTEEEFWIPAPHSHSFPPANIPRQEALLDHFPWQHFDLQPGDEWE